MNRFGFALLIALTGTLFLAATASAGPHSGLWVGTATLKYVSEVNKQYSDLSFDLGLVGVKAHDTLISEKESWIYNDTNTGPDYPNPGWTDNAEKKAPYGFGYDDQNKVATEVLPQTTVYFRKPFTVVDPSLYTGLRVRVWRDDGVVLSLNGEEIFRNNLPAQCGPNTFALSEIIESSPQITGDPHLVEFTLPATLLQENDPTVAGDRNLLEAEVHQAEGSTDLLFDLELIATLKEPATSELIPQEAGGWKYHDSQWGPGADSEEDLIDEDWPALSYPDSDPSVWKAGQGQFGYGENDEKTTVSKSTSTVYFRKKFSGNNADFTHLRVLLLRDDGVVLYLNGDEILRSNMPPGAIEHSTSPVKALGAADEDRYIVVDLTTPPLNPGEGTNVLAAELHQHPAELGGSTGTGQGALTRTSAPLDLRLLFHVDEGGRVRLLKEVIQVYDSSAKEYVLLTDHTLIPDYTGVAIRDGVPVGRRLSAVGFDFQGTALECTGEFGPNGSAGIECSITLASGHATNPFLHRYHPDHDNLDARYESPVEDAYEITRDISLTFSGRYPPDEDAPQREVEPAGWGDTLLGGYYTEILTGLYKDAITVSGPFILRRVVTTDRLTP